MTHLSSLVSEAGLEVLCDEARAAPPGAIVEVGVYKGGSAARLWHVAREQGREIFLYDTFTGHPHTDPSIDDHPLGRFADAVDPNALREALPGAHVIVGTFPDSLVEMPPIAFVHADADLYQVTLDICSTLPWLMVPGGVMIFDDYAHGDCRGCKKAVDECFPDRTLLRDGRAKVVMK